MKLVLIFIMALLNGFFVMAEYSLVRIRKSRLEELIQQGNGSAKTVLKMTLSLDTYLSATQMGITIASLALGWLGARGRRRLRRPGRAHSIGPSLRDPSGGRRRALGHHCDAGAAMGR